MKSIRRTFNHAIAPNAIVLLATMIGMARHPAIALVVIHSECTWPADWPKALEEVRNKCTTYECATGTQENVYEIVFDHREEFERLWPALLAVRTPGSPLRLSPIRKEPEARLFNSAKPTVRIWGPSESVTIAGSQADNRPWNIEKLLEGGKALRVSPPWPPELVSAKGELPEYLQAVEQDGCLIWVPGTPGESERGFRYRARVELELVVDGSIIDLNRVQLPDDATIVDRRFVQTQGPE